jgi:predicted ATPase/DNA-binding XRE family transcriptional regulator
MQNVNPPAGFGTLLRRSRLAAGLSQEALAERAGLSVESISALERGFRQSPYRTTVDLLAAGLRLNDLERATLAAAARRGRSPRESPPRAESSLPAYATSFFDRERERADLAALLRSARAITVCGPGGVGKTRLAIEAANALRGPAMAVEKRFVELASLRDPEHVFGRIAASIGLAAGRAEAGIAAIIEALQARELLLIIDNCEHLIERCAHAIEAIVRGCPNVRVLATSREPLLIDGEAIYRLTPFADDAPAIALFVERAGSAVGGTFEPDHAVVESIARRLDGIPLAIELAAALARTQSATEIARTLTGPAFLSLAQRRTAIEHQRTMEATLAWSYLLLSEPERELLRTLAYPAAGTPRAALDAVVGVPSTVTVQGLIDKSLVVEEKDTGRLRLHEMTRQYVASITAAAETAQIARRYGDWLAARMNDSFATGWRTSSYAVYDSLAIELDNLRQAFDRALSERDANGARGLASAPDYWTAIGRTPEGFRWLSRIAAELDLDGADPRDATVFFGIAMCAAQSGMGIAAREPGRRAAEIANRHGSMLIAARCEIVRSNALLALGDPQGAADGLARATTLFESAGDATGRARSLSFRALALVELEQPRQAASALAQVVRLHAEMPDPVGASEELVVEMVLGDIARLEGDLATALDRAREATALLGAGHRTWIHLRAMHQYVDALIAANDVDGAVALALPELKRLNERGFVTDFALLIERIALALIRRGATRSAAFAAGFARAVLAGADRRRMLFDRRVRAQLDAELEQAMDAAECAGLQDAGRSEDAATLLTGICDQLSSRRPAAAATTSSAARRTKC